MQGPKIRDDGPGLARLRRAEQFEKLRQQTLAMQQAVTKVQPQTKEGRNDVHPRK